MIGLCSDFPGQVTHDWFDAMYPDVARAGIVFTAIGIVTADPGSVESVLVWAERLQRRVRYLIVENSITAKTDFSYWRDSREAQQFQKIFQVAMIQMDYRLPELENATRNYGVTLGEVAARTTNVLELKKASLVMRAESYRRRMFAQFEKVIPKFGNWMLTAISAEHVIDFRSDLIKADKSPGYIRKLMAILNRFFGDAITDGYLKVSPMPALKRRHHGSNHNGEDKSRALSPDQAKMLLAECEAGIEHIADEETGKEEEKKRKANPELRLVILLGLLAGLRRGELFCLHYADIDWTKDVIHVHRNLYWRYGRHNVRMVNPLI